MQSTTSHSLSQAPQVSARHRPGRWTLAGWSVFTCSVIATLLTDLLGTPVVPILSDHLHFFDLGIYRQAAGAVLGGHPLYVARFQLGFGFTYPPFAALVMLGLQGLPWRVDEVVVTAINLALVLGLARMALELRAPGPAGVDSASRRPWLWFVAAVLLWTEPVRSTIAYGQIDLLVAGLVLADLSLAGRRPHWAGVGIGLAAALKLTPLIFIPYLILSGRPRMALRATAVFAAAIATSFLVLPRDAATYWFGAVFDVSRVTGHHSEPAGGPANQSLHGMLVRLDGAAGHLSTLWLGAILLVALAGLWLAVRAARRGDELLGFVLTAITGLLVCPVSWTHHWVIATPVLMFFLRARRGARAAMAGGASLLAALGSSAVWIDNRPPQGHPGVGQFLLANLYVLAGVGFIASIAGWEISRVLSRAGRGELDERTRVRASHPGHPGTRPSRPREAFGSRELAGRQSAT